MLAYHNKYYLFIIVVSLKKKIIKCLGKPVKIDNIMSSCCNKSDAVGLYLQL